jgi:hypothetical protein
MLSDGYNVTLIIRQTTSFVAYILGINLVVFLTVVEGGNVAYHSAFSLQF